MRCLAVAAIVGGLLTLVLHTEDASTSASEETATREGRELDDESRPPGATPATTPTVPPAPVSTRPPTTVAPTIEIVFTGDIIPHDRVNRVGAEVGFVELFDPEVRNTIAAADLAICHLEAPVAAGEPEGYPTFNAPIALLEALGEVGFDGCSTASNHTLDQGADGAIETVAAFDELGLEQAGINPDGTLGWASYEIEGVRFAHLSWTYGLNGFRNPDDNPLLVPTVPFESVDPEGVEIEGILAAAAAAQVGADHVIVSLHWGAEYRHEPTTAQRAIAERLGASPDVDLLVGHHAHVIQPHEVIAGTHVAFGLGNFLSNNFTACCPEATRYGVIMHARFGPDGVEVQWTPTMVDRATMTVVPADAEVAAITLAHLDGTG